jgi:hypothetical protein
LELESDLLEIVIINKCDNSHSKTSVFLAKIGCRADELKFHTREAVVAFRAKNAARGVQKLKIKI